MPTDPRGAHDDITERERREALDPAAFERAAESQAAATGWVAFALAFDDDGRVLLVQDDWAGGWNPPAGALEPGETLAETVEREVREETGVEVTAVRPHSVDDYRFEHAETGETDGWTGVLFEARAETTAIREDLGMDDDEAIADARWFAELPDELFNADLLRTVYARCGATGDA